VLTGDNILPGKMKWEPMPAGNLVRALKNGQVSAIVVQEPYIYQAESQLGAVEVFDACSGPTSDLPLSGYFSTKAYAKGNSALLTSFRNELQKVQASAALPGPRAHRPSQRPRHEELGLADHHRVLPDHT
jgi:ABC-type nitrate/sulfonate/bicarbonate transport system substrate-binding protein